MNSSGRQKIAIVLDESFLPWKPPEWFVPRLRNDFPQVEVARSGDLRRDQMELRDADIMIGSSLTAERLAAAPQLKWIYSVTAATDEFPTRLLATRGIPLVTAGPVHGPVVAEHAIALVLALARRLDSAMRFQDGRKWAMDTIWKEDPPRQLRGSTLTVVGLGCIGGNIAALAAALSMHVIGIRQRPELGAAGAHEVVGPDGLNGAIARSDFVVLAAPGDGETRHLIDARRLALFRPQGYLVNVSRGSLIDEDALLKALKQRRLAGAALDVFHDEPLPSRSPFWKMPQVLVTHHTAFLTNDLWERHYAFFTSNLTQYLAGASFRPR